LTVEQVIAIRLQRARGEISYYRLAKELKVKDTVVRNAALGLTYKDIPMPPRPKR
jgi:ribosome-binding protein aMBF1 (putative translation factor)